MAIRSRKSSKTLTSKPKRMSDAAVAKATGKTWKEWFAFLDKAGGRKLNHQQIVAVAATRHGVRPWWQQMVTVTYEQAHGLRKVHEKADGFSISRSKTVPVPIARLYKVWAEPKTRGKWLSESGLTIRKATVNRSIRMLWSDKMSTVETMFYPKGAGKSQVTVQHNKLPSAGHVAKMKKYWGERLDRMVKVLAH